MGGVRRGGHRPLTWLDSLLGVDAGELCVCVGGGGGVGGAWWGRGDNMLNL